jgi:hypothetical protein
VEINESLFNIGLPPLDDKTYNKLMLIDGIHLDYREIFTNPKGIYEYLTELPFDPERHEFLMEIEMQPKFSGLKIGHEVTRQLFKELAG